MRVEPFDGDTGPLSRLVTEWPFKPYRWVDVSPDAVRALAFSRLRQSVARNGVQTWIAREGGVPIGLASLEPLSWDSRMLGITAGRAEFMVAGEYRSRKATFDALLAAVLSGAREAGVDHLSVRVDAADDAAIHALEAAGFLGVDALLTFERGVGAGSGAEAAENLTIREVRPGDISAIEAMAASSFVDGRFHTDPSISADRAASIYREWAAACCSGAAADGVVVATTRAGEIAGFVACRIHADTGEYLERLTASIVLVATASTARRRGVGRAIVLAAVDWVRERSAVAMQVGTQIRNTAAARLYENCGFRLAAGSQSFRSVVSR